MAVEFDTPGYMRPQMSSIWSNDVSDANYENKRSTFAHAPSSAFRAIATAPMLTDLFRDSSNIVSSDPITGKAANYADPNAGKDCAYSASNLFSSCWSPVPDEKLNSLSSWPWIDTDQNRLADERSDSVHSGSDSLTSPPQLSPNGQHPWADASDRAARPFELFNNGSSNGKLQAEDAHRRNHMARSAWNGTAAGGRTERQNFDLAETMRQFDQLYVSPDSASVAANTFGRSISYGNCEGVKQHQRMPHSPNSAPVLQKKNYEAAANCWSNPASRSDPTLNGRKQSANAWSYANYSNSLDTEASKANYFRPIVGQASESLSSPGSSNSSVSCEGSPVNGHVAYPNPEQAYNYANPRQQRAVVTCDEAELNWYHQQLELQQSIYEHFYNLLLCGQLPLPAGMNRAFANTRNTLPTSMQFARNNTAAGDLHQRLEQVTESYRRMEKERKKTEAELARHNLGKRISSANSLPIPRLPPAPSRVDRLVVDFFREHARMVTLLGKMEQLRGAPFDDKVHQVMRELLDAVRVLQQRRLNERTAILQQLRGDIGRYNEEKEAAQLTLSLMEVNRCVIRARSANWCALMWTIGSTTEEQRRLIEEIVAANFSLEPPEIKLCAVPV